MSPPNGGWPQIGERGGLAKTGRARLRYTHDINALIFASTVWFPDELPLTMKTPKTLGQVAYESTPDEGGKSNFGEWDQAPDVVRRVHEKMAKAIEREVKKRTKYTQRKDGEGWEEESHRVFKLACCDCGLVHDVVIVAGKKGTKIGVAAKRNPRATGQRRRHASGNT